MQQQACRDGKQAELSRRAPEQPRCRNLSGQESRAEPSGARTAARRAATCRDGKAEHNSHRRAPELQPRRRNLSGREGRAEPSGARTVPGSINRDALSSRDYAALWW